MEIMQPTDDGYKIEAVVQEGNLVFTSGQKIPLVSLFMTLMMR